MSAAEPAPIGSWRRLGAWAGIAHPGRFGNPEGAPGLRVRAVEPAAVATLIVDAARLDDLARTIRARFAIELPRTPRRVVEGGVAVSWAGHRQWLVAATDPAAIGRLAEAAGDAAAIVDQGCSRGFLRLSGPRVRDVLAKGCVLDLHPRAFAAGDVALTMVSHLSVHLAQTDDDPVFELSVARSYAGSLWHWLLESAQEWGVQVGPMNGES